MILDNFNIKCELLVVQNFKPKLLRLTQDLLLSHISSILTHNINYLILRLVVAQRSERVSHTFASLRQVKRDRLWIRFPLDEIHNLIFSFFHSSVMAKRGVEFRHLSCIQNSAENGNWSVFTLGSLYIYKPTPIKQCQ